MRLKQYAGRIYTPVEQESAVVPETTFYIAAISSEEGRATVFVKVYGSDPNEICDAYEMHEGDALTVQYEMKEPTVQRADDSAEVKP